MAKSRKRSRWTYEFTAVKGSRINDRDAQCIGPVLARLSERDGEIRADAVVEAARSPRSKLHAYFQWDERRAAEEHWRSTARRLIRAVQIQVRVARHAPPKTVRAFVKLDRNVGYKPMTEVLRRDDYREMFLARALEEFESWVRRHENTIDFAKTFPRVKAMLVHARQQLRA